MKDFIQRLQQFPKAWGQVELIKEYNKWEQEKQ